MSTRQNSVKIYLQIKCVIALQLILIFYIITNGDTKIETKILPLVHVRQEQKYYGCGAACAASVAQWFYRRSENDEHLEITFPKIYDHPRTTDSRQICSILNQEEGYNKEPPPSPCSYCVTSDEGERGCDISLYSTGLSCMFLHFYENENIVKACRADATYYLCDFIIQSECLGWIPIRPSGMFETSIAEEIQMNRPIIIEYGGKVRHNVVIHGVNASGKYVYAMDPLDPPAGRVFYIRKKGAYNQTLRFLQYPNWMQKDAKIDRYIERN